MPEPKNIKFFKTEASLRKWFEKNHDKRSELWLGMYKKGSGKASVTYGQAVEQALCFGWIDGIAKGIDEEKYCQRFTPRKSKSTWSAINIKKIDELKKMGLMHPAGLKAFNERDVTKTNRYSFEQKDVKLPPAYEKVFKRNKKAWKYFSELAPGYMRSSIWYVISPKQETTRLRRLETLIADSEAGRKLKQFIAPRKSNK